MSYPEMARDFLDIHLPIALREICDLQTLKLESTSFIEQDLRAYYSDVVWSLKPAKVRAIFIVLLNIRVPRYRIWHFA